MVLLLVVITLHKVCKVLPRRLQPAPAAGQSGHYQGQEQCDGQRSHRPHGSLLLIFAF
ncbi:MAG: hypothetical protein Q8P95_03220 [bacterium]|nr:hypothetical protein [bacterium]